MDRRMCAHVKARAFAEFVRRDRSMMKPIDHSESVGILVHSWNAIPAKNVAKAWISK
jgi:hypothetical protein